MKKEGLHISEHQNGLRLRFYAANLIGSEHDVELVSLNQVRQILAFPETSLQTTQLIRLANQDLRLVAIDDRILLAVAKSKKLRLVPCIAHSHNSANCVA